MTVRFGAVWALESMDLTLRPGEIHGLCGENGAGKSTLIRALGGAIAPASGRVTIDGAEFGAGVRAAESAGISVIHQEPLSFPDLSAEDTIYLGREPSRLGGLWLDRGAMRRGARGVLSSLGESLDSSRPVGELALAQRQMVAIARALVTKCRFLILDEPTASLSGREADLLHRLVRDLSARGVGVLLVSHRLEEVLALSHRITVMRDGRRVATREVGGFTRDDLVRLMVGRDVAGEGPRRRATIGDIVLEAEDLSRRGVFSDVSFQLRAGEILGLGGLVGAGRSEIVRVLAGVDRADTGRVVARGKDVAPGSVRRAVRAGIVMVPEDRREQGLVLALPVSTNIGMSDPPGLVRLGFLRRRRERALAERSATMLSIKAPSLAAPASTLSGGNQQKVLLGKWLAPHPAVLILDEPTRGIDVGSKAAIHDLIRRLADEGMAVILVSSDMPELLALSDRVLVVRRGRVAGQLTPDEANPERVLALAVPGEGG